MLNSRQILDLIANLKNVIADSHADFRVQAFGLSFLLLELGRRWRNNESHMSYVALETHVSEKINTGREEWGVSVSEISHWENLEGGISPCMWLFIRSRIIETDCSGYFLTKKGRTVYLEYKSDIYKALNTCKKDYERAQKKAEKQAKKAA